MSGLKRGSSRQVLNTFRTILRKDEEMMRILHYLPENREIGTLDPLDANLPNIVDETSEKYWDRVDYYIKTTPKSQKIEEETMCRLYLYSGKRRPRFDSYVIADQEILIDVFVHDDYSNDLRMEWINDRLNYLLALERLDGIYGKLEYAGGNPRVAPIGYSHYEHRFVFLMEKK